MFSFFFLSLLFSSPHLMFMCVLSFIFFFMKFLVSHPGSACGNFKISWSGPWTTRAGSDKYTLINLPLTYKINHAHYIKAICNVRVKQIEKLYAYIVQAYQLGKLAILIGNFCWENSDTILSEYNPFSGHLSHKSSSKTVSHLHTCSKQVPVWVLLFSKTSG